MALQNVLEREDWTKHRNRGLPLVFVIGPCPYRQNGDRVSYRAVVCRCSFHLAAHHRLG